MRKYVLLAVMAVAVAVVTNGVALAKSWAARPIIVHEWGVNVYDWATGAPRAEKLPKFIHTNQKPGRPVPAPPARVKDMPPDSGIRRKPILYFYPPTNTPVSVGVEVRFAHGYAKAWWPQANVYRTPQQVARAKPVDWAAWRKQHGHWQRSGVKVPDDERFELAWYNLTLTKNRPKDPTQGGKHLADDHWVKVARQVDAHYVSNGKQAEQYLFYEGATTRTPCIAVLPVPGAKRHHVVNVGDEPIHDVLVIFRGANKSKRWTRYLPVLQPVPQADPKALQWGHDVPQVMALSIPDFNTLPAAEWDDEETFLQRTKWLLLKVLTAGEHRAQRWYRGMRDPADPQPPTKMHMLYWKEAAALEKIWRKDFFRSDGLTIIYRESPAQLDKAMPLRIYTNMSYYVMLSRCGLVLNQGVPYQGAAGAAEAVRMYAYEKDPAKRKAHLNVCLASRFLAVGAARYALRQEQYPDQSRLKKLIGLLGGQVAEAPSAAQAKALWDKHQRDARQWASLLRQARLTKSHYGPWFNEKLSVVYEGDEPSKLAYYFYMMKPQGFDPAKVERYRYGPRDVLVEYDLKTKSWSLAWPKAR